MSYRVGVDIGGSFTDFALFDEDTRELRSLKVFSRPDQPGAEVVHGVEAAQARYGIAPESIGYFTHGTTIAINTVIQRKGLKLALFTTEHFRDVLEIGRLKIPDMYNLLSKRAAPLVTRDLVFGIPERIKADGTVEQALDEEAVDQALAAARRAGAEGVVVAFLHAYRNSRHELQARQLIERLVPGFPVFCSSETWPIIREYERTITAVIGGYVQPRVEHYLGSLQKALKDLHVPAEPRLTKSNGGVMTAEQGKRDCVQMILSGTASGVIGAGYVARTAGVGRCMSLDIGGTSADVAIIVDGEPQYGVGERIGEFQIYIPSVSVSSIGEGGGSIAWVDSLGVLKVGPESAGSRPGPACYGLGGTRATITDAFVACGLIGHAELGYNAVTVDVERARAAVAALATRLGRGVEETAQAIIEVAVSGMYAAMSGLVSRFGVDPRDFSLLSFGGAGPMLACFLARELGMKEVLVPPTPGVLSALGGLIADLKNDFLETLYCDLAPGVEETIKSSFAALRERALAWLRTDQGYPGDYRLLHSAEMRYRGQSFEIDTALDEQAIALGDLAALAGAFHREHARLYGHADETAAVQVISLRLVIVGHTPKPEFLRRPLVPGAAPARGFVQGHLDGRACRLALYDRSALQPGHGFAGPAVVLQDDCTTVVPADFTVTVDDFSNLRIAPGARA